MSSDLRSIGRSQALHLEEFRSSEEATLLARLAQTECLLEIAKLSGLRLDLASYAGMVIGIVTQFVPSRGCSIELTVPDVPPIAASFGTLSSADASGHALTINEGVVGQLAVLPELEHLTPPEFIAMIADQVSSSLGALVEAERLRRQAAIAETIHLVEVLSDEPSREDLNNLVQALSSLPNALGAYLEVNHSAFNGSVVLSAGAPPQDLPAPSTVPGGAVTVAIRWATTAQPRDRESLEEITAMLSIALGKSEERRRLRDEAETDPLTGVGNRRRAVRALAAAIDTAERVEDYVGVVYLDLDHFKRVNDTLGHDVGDQVLVSFARHLEAMVRAYDSVNRIGGEEFLIVCPGLDERDGASFARRIVEATPRACAPALPAGWVQTASAGVAIFPLASAGSDALLQAADRALYDAKHRGRNQVRLASEVDAQPRC